MARPGTIRLYCYVNQEEKDIITQHANSLNISISSLIKLSALSKPMPDEARNDLIIELSKLRADLARLGNMQRDTIDKKQQLSPTLQNDIKATHMRLKDILNEI